MAQLVLWDVDHTLIENAGVSKEIYAGAYEILTGRRPLHPAPTEGRTDPLIMRGLFELHDEPVPPWAETEQALEASAIRHASALRARGWILPGVRAAIAVLAARPALVQSVLSGNIRANARVKLEAFGLDVLLDLDVGAYGDDHEVRAELVKVAQKRAGAKYGAMFDPINTVLIGDTPRDVEAALIGGARVAAVASGEHSIGELAAAGAASVLPDLRDTGGLVRLVLSPEGNPSDPPVETR